MKSHFSFALLVLLTGCATDEPGVEKGLHNTIAYKIQIEASEPARIEVNHEIVGSTPVSIRVFGDRDGTFHNFGSDEFVVRACPNRTNEFPQTRIFKTGTMGVLDDLIPNRIYFNFAAPANPAKSAGR